MSARPHAMRQRRVATLPNLLSLLRVLLLPLSIWALERQTQIGVIPVLLIIGAALGTDALDGLVARWRGSVSDVGRIVDPLADKIYLAGLLLYLALERQFPLWLVALTVTRDVLLVGASTLLLRRYEVVFSANVWGKISTIVLSVLVIAFVVEARPLVPWLTGAAAAALAASTFVYVRDGWRFIARARRDRATAAGPPGRGALC